MRANNAIALLEIEAECKKLFPFKSGLSRAILLVLAASDGTCAMKHILRVADATPIAVRQHIQYLVESRLLIISTNANNQREKVVELTDLGVQLLRRHETNVQRIISNWNL